MLCREEVKKKQKVKCVVWDLDNTIWNGILLEDNQVVINDNILDIIITLDSRGILQSIASKNDYAVAMAKLKEFKIDEYFLYPQINWNPKSNSVKQIAQLLNIGTDSLAFVDDQYFELEEVSFSLPEVLCIDVNNISLMLEMNEMNPYFITQDSKLRRQMYMSDIKRKKIEMEYVGTQEDFLASLNMIFSIAPVEIEDLQRAEELTIRTHQLNTTGYTYSYEELSDLMNSGKHKLFITGLEDKYGSYGKIGLTLLELEKDIWTIKLLLMSCRVMSRGVGTVMLNYVMKLAEKAGVKLYAEFIPNDRNRMMYVTYKFAGFKEVNEQAGVSILECDYSQIQPFPKYLELRISE